MKMSETRELQNRRALARLMRVVPNRDGWHSGHDLRRPVSCVMQIDATSW